MLKIKRVRKNRKQSGQGMTEYIIIVGLIAIFLIAAVNNFGGALNTAFESSTAKIKENVLPAIAGTAGTSSAGTAATAATAANAAAVNGTSN